MANYLNRLDASFPHFTGRESPQEMVAAILDYMYQQAEELKYTLQNLDSSNFNETGLAGLKLDTVKDVKQAIKELAEATKQLGETVQQLAGKVEKLEPGVQQNTEDLEVLKPEVKRLGDRQRMQDLSFRPDGLGGGVIGAEGQTINLVGTVLVNGKPVGG